MGAERLRLMGFDNRLIIDFFANLVNILLRSDSEEKNMNALLRRSRNERSQFMVKNTPQRQKQSKAQDCPSGIVAC